MILYRISIFLYRAAISFISNWNSKAKRWIQLREEQQLDPPAFFREKKKNYRIWMHVASLGEFEQGRPILEKLKAGHPGIELIVSFFSPSGYDRVSSAFIDQKLVLPMDNPQNAKAFIRNVDPDLVIFVKYEFWYYYLKELETRNIPVIFISALFRKNHWFFNALCRPMLEVLKKTRHFFVQDENSKEILARYDIDQVTIAGDNRIDRVLSLTESPADLEQIRKVLDTPVDIVCGSVWRPDTAILVPVIRERNLSAIIAPHEIREAYVSQLKKEFGDACVLFSELPVQDRPDKPRVLILDTIGLLSRVYRLGKSAYVGGGFGPGIHNTLEPAAYGIPVIFGPRYKKFTEAVSFVKMGVAFSVRNKQELNNAYEALMQPERIEHVKGELSSFFEKRKGGTSAVYQYIHNQFLKPLST